MNAQIESGLVRFLKFTAFIFLLWFIYYALLSLFIFIHNGSGFERLDYVRPYFVSTAISPYLLFLLIIVSMQWLRWLYALYNKHTSTDLFVENYFLPVLYGSTCSFFIVVPVLILPFEINSGYTSLSDLWTASFNVICLYMPLFFLLVALVRISGRFAEYPSDRGLTGACVAGVLLTAVLDFFSYTRWASTFYPLCHLSDYSGVTLLVACLFFKSAELITRPYLSEGYKPHHTVFAVPACIVMLVMFYINLLSGVDALCYDWGSHDDPFLFNATTLLERP